MRKLIVGLMLSAATAWPAIAVPVRLPRGAQSGYAAAPPRYNSSKEVSLEGTVASVVTKPAPGMLAGAHLMVATSTGTVDAHLGNYAMRGPNALALSPGERVKVVGVMATVQSHHVLMVRTVQAGLNYYKIRNECGFLIRTVPSGLTGRVKTAPGGQP
jgi:hypothetical protein